MLYTVCTIFKVIFVAGFRVEAASVIAFFGVCLWMSPLSALAGDVCPVRPRLPMTLFPTEAKVLLFLCQTGIIYLRRLRQASLSPLLTSYARIIFLFPHNSSLPQMRSDTWTATILSRKVLTLAEFLSIYPPAITILRKYFFRNRILHTLYIYNN